MLLQHGKACVHRRVVLLCAPVALERRIEHLAQPVDDHRLLDLRQDVVVDARVVLRRFGARRERAARHEDDAAAELLDGRALFFVGGDDALERMRTHGQVVGARTARHVTAAFGDRTADELERIGPIEPHAALRRVHRLGDAQPERPQVAAVGERGVPVERRGGERVAVTERVAHHVRRGVGHAAADRSRWGAPRDRLTQRVRRQRAVGAGEADGGRHSLTIAM